MEYTEWQDFRKELFTPEELAIKDAKTDFLCELIEARRKKGYSQKKLGEKISVKQPVIARLEKGRSNPQLETIIKMLLPLGFKLTIEPIEAK